MRWFRFAVLLLFVTLLQADLVDTISLTAANIRPDLLLVLVVFFAVYCDITKAIITSFAVGFAADIIGPAMGPHMLSFGLCGTLLAYLHSVLAVRKMPYQSLLIFITALLSGGFVHLFTFLKAPATASADCSVLFGTSLYSALVGPFLFLPLAWWMRIKTHWYSRP